MAAPERSPSRHEVATQDRTVTEKRNEHRAVASRCFFVLVDRWKLSDAQASKLLGNMPYGHFYHLRSGRTEYLDVNKEIRIRYLVEIFKLLRALYSRTMADSWANLPNTDPRLRGLTPLEYMGRGGIQAMKVLSGMLEARKSALRSTPRPHPLRARVQGRSEPPSPVDELLALAEESAADPG